MFFKTINTLHAKKQAFAPHLSSNLKKGKGFLYGLFLLLFKQDIAGKIRKNFSKGNLNHPVSEQQTSRRTSIS